MRGAAPILLVLAAALLWSTGGLFIKATTLPAGELSFWRSLLAGATVAFLTRREGFRLNAVAGIAAVLYAGVLFLFVAANKLTTAANAIFLQYTAPVYILLFGPLLYGEALRRRDIAVVAVCLAGMALFFVGELRPQDVSGNLAALGSGVCFAFFTLLLRHPGAAPAVAGARVVNPAAPVIYGSLLLALLTAPAVLAGGGGPLSAREAAILAYLGVVQLGVAYTLFVRGIARGVRPLDAGIAGYVEPVLNPVWVFLFLGERPAPWAILGGAIILAAVLAHTCLTAGPLRFAGKRTVE